MHADPGDVAYWTQLLADHPERVQAPTDKPRPAVRLPTYATVAQRPSQAVATRVRRNAQQQVAWFCAAAAIFVGKMAATKRFVLGLSSGGILPVLVELSPTASFHELCERLDGYIREGEDHALLEVQALSRSLGLPFDPARSALYDVGIGDGEPSGDLHLRIRPDAIELVYDTNLFTAELAERLLRSFAHVLSSVDGKPEQLLGAVSLLEGSDASRLLEEFSSPHFNWPAQSLLHELFEARVDQHPNAIAIACNGTTLTYGELERRANGVAHELVGRGVGPDAIVALLFDRTPEMVVAILGTLKAGGAYLPIEPDAPQERIDFVLRDSGARVVLAGMGHAEKVPAGTTTLVVGAQTPTDSRPKRSCEPHHLAYVIYTSGSTGTPKGVLIEHRNVVHLILAEREDFDVRPTEALILLSSYTFDASIDQIWLALTTGAKLVLVDKDIVLDAALLSQTIVREGVTHLDTIPSLLAGLSPRDVPSVQRVVVGGESCSAAVARAWGGSVRLFNEYGPTETTVGSMRHRVTEMADGDTRVPIGSPIGKTRAYVLDWGGQLVPVGVRGELCIGGAGVARGYLNREELTRERFIRDPFGGSGDRMYRTGDLVAWRPDGLMDFFGRIDNQVKVRGFRIELGEIEAALLRHPLVTDAAVTIAGEGDDNQRLVCHYEARQPLASEEVAQFLARTLPSYMVPSGFLQLGALPKTVGGKVDRRKLPPVPIDAGDVEEPRDALESELRDLWSELLKVPCKQISVTRSFFQLGGHSLLVSRLASRIQQRMGVLLRVATILAQPTIRAIAEAIAEEGRKGDGAIRRADLGTVLPATAVQRVMYIMQQRHPNSTAHNLPLLYEIEGDLDEAILANAFASIIDRHEALRTGFFFQEGNILQKVAENAKPVIEHFDLGEARTVDGSAEGGTSHARTIDGAMAAFVRPFVLEEPPLLRIAIFREAGRARFLALDIHHMVTDGMSIETMLEELILLARGESLPEPKLRYFDHAAWIESDEGKQRVERAKPYWMDVLKDELPSMDLPTDRPMPTAGHGNAGDVTVTFSRDKLEAIVRYARAAQATPFAFFAAVYSLFLSSKTGRSDVLFGYPVSGRPHPDFDRVIGMFVNLLVFRTRVEGTGTFSSFLEATMRQVRESLQNEDYPIDNLTDDLKLEAQPGRKPLINTMLSYEGFTPGAYAVGQALLRETRVNQREAKDDLAIIVREAEAGYTIWFEYSEVLFDEDTVRGFASDFVAIIDRVLTQPDVLLSKLHTVRGDEQTLLLERFNATAHALPNVGGVHELFQQRAREDPDAPAVTMGDETWSYAELERRAHRVAAQLGQRGIGREAIVGIVMEPCHEMVSSLVGVLEAGAAFLPIDIGYPDARKAHMLSDSAAGVVLVHGDRARRSIPSSYDGEVIDLAIENREAQQGPVAAVQRSDAAYVIYTSGSTGQPKGVIIEHGNLLNFATWIAESLHFTPKDVVSKYASFGFDSSVGEIVPALIAGAHLVIVPEDIRLLMDDLDRYFAKHRVTVADLPTQFAEQFLRVAERHQLRAVRLGGEKLRSLPTTRCEILNEYGPTECTVVATSYRVEKQEDNIPIGRPGFNTQILILDELDRLAPMGVPGELCIAGLGVGRGYLHLPELTEERFVHHPLARGGRIYRSGDLARWRRDGNIEFLGRVDTQVKIRGFRVELGEIERALMGHDGIRDAVVVARENPQLPGDFVLVAFVTGSGEDETVLRATLEKTLPPYMVPARIVYMDAIPITSNGKVDKRRLPTVDLTTSLEVVLPRTATETALRDLYASCLGVDAERIGIDVTFLQLGGHSLKAAMLLSAIYGKFGVQLRLAHFLETSSIDNVAVAVDAELGRGVTTRALPKVAREITLPLTASQARILAVQQLAPWSTAYNIPISWELRPDVDLDRLVEALRALPGRHDALRASFPSVDGKVTEHFQKASELHVASLSAADANVDGVLEGLVEPFDLSRAPLMHANLVTTETRKILMVDLHHIIADGMSFPVLLKDLEAIYSGEASARTGIDFADYVAWEQSPEAHAKKDLEKAWWLERFSDVPNQLELPYDNDRPAQPLFEGEELSMDLSANTAARLFDLANAQSVTPLNAFLAAWALVLSRLGNTQDLVVGVPTFGRHVAGTNDIVGMFVNTVPVRMRLSRDETFRDFVSRIGLETTEAFDRQAYHLSDLVLDLGLPRSATRNPLFDVVFEWQEDDANPDSLLGLSELPPPSTSAKFDLELTIDKSDDGVRLLLAFSTTIFKRATVERFLGYLRRVLDQAAARPDATMKDFRIMEPWQREMLLVDFNPAAAPPAGSTLTDLFDVWTRTTPDAIAVEDAGGAYSYAEVDRRASTLARELVRRGVRPDDVVAFTLERSKDLLVAIVGIAKTGATYLPLEPDSPEERARTILADADAVTLVTDGPTFGLPAERCLSWRSLDGSRGTGSVPSLATPRGAAYIIYTSGSTGKPKGVVIEHHSMANYAESSAKAFGLTKADGVLLFSSVTFDASVEQIGIALAAGARLVVPSRSQILDLEAFEAFLIDKNVTFLHAVPLFLSSYKPKRRLGLKWVISGADVCPVPVAERWSKLAAFYNEYGPTETTVAALRHRVSAADLKGNRIPVGKPAAGARLYVLDWTGNLAPMGVAGELYIGGSGVARGYKNNGPLTNERFLPNPYVPGERFYRTGDLVRFRPDGTLEFLGRADDQVKIRGFRIELGEVEAGLLRHPDVVEAAAVVIADGEQKRLCAYVVVRAENAEEAEPSEIRAFVARHLPSYMVPDAVVALPSLPVTTSGKLDRKRLPAPAFEALTAEDAPATDGEWKLAAIWGRVLNLPVSSVSVERTFFEQGGHSLLIMSLIVGIQEAFGVRLLPAQIFDHPTIRSLVPFLATLDRCALAPIPKYPERQRYPLSSVQRRLFAIQLADPESVTYNVPFLFDVDGHVTRGRLEEVVRALIARHASLRTCFAVEQGEPVAHVMAALPYHLEEIQSDETPEELTERLVRPFDLTAAPLFRVVLVVRTDGRETLFVDFHHIVVDGTSTSILFEEVRTYLSGGLLPPLRIHYGDFALWQETPEHVASVAKAREFWMEQYRTLPPALELPYDFRRPAMRTHAGDLVSTSLTTAEMEALLELSRSNDATVFITLLAALYVFLSRLGGTDDIVVGVPTSGRAHPDLQGLVGMFVNTVPWRLRVPPCGSFVDFLKHAKAMSIEFLSREDYQLESLLGDLEIRAEPGTNPLFAVMFSYLGGGEPDEFEAGSVRLVGRDVGTRTAKMDLSVIATESPLGIDLAFEFTTELFERTSVERFAEQFGTLLRSILANPNADILSLEMLPSEERRLLETFNATAHELPPGQGVHELFESWVERTPNADAVVCGPVRWTYREVNERAEVIAGWLERADVRPGDRVAVLLEPCADQLPAVLGAFKAGAVVVPIDTTYPTGRQEYMLSDSGARALLTHGPRPSGLQFHGAHLDLSLAEGAGADAKIHRTKRAGTRRDGAYVIYTSGSTGRPKGVLVEHGSLLNLTAWYADDFAIQPGDGVGRYFSFSFDGSVIEIYPACAAGGRLVVVPRELRLDVRGLSDYFARHRVVVASFPTQFGEQFLQLTDYRGLRRVMLGGEKLRVARRGSWELVNAYGPTECTCINTRFIVDGQRDSIPIGKPIWNTRVYVLDRHGRICPIGVAGEIHIAGVGVASGYLNRPELTRERFLPDPFAPGERMYRTGDIGRWLPDGNLDCLGRTDHQVKVRGYRIELGEIEAALLEVPGLTGAAVVDHADAEGQKILVAYLVSTEPLDTPAIQVALRRELPEYMVPTHFQTLDRLPLTANGKVDRQALPSLELGEAAAVDPAENEMERALVPVWSRVLGLDETKIGVTSRFVDLGGHSLRAVALVAEIYRLVHVEITVRDIFDFSTIRGLASELLRRGATTGASAPQALIPALGERERAPLSSVQRRLFAMHQAHPDAVTYNIPSVFAVEGATSKERVTLVMRAMMERHASLRTSFVVEHGEPVAVVAKDVTIPLAELRSDEPLEAITSRLVKPFDLAKAPLARVTLIERSNGAQVLLVDVHHIIFDGTSSAILWRDARDYLAGRPLVPLRIGYADYAAWLSTPEYEVSLQSHRKFWAERLASLPAELALPTDRARPLVRTYEGDAVTVNLPASDFSALTSLCQKEGTTPFVALISAFFVFLSRASGVDDLVVGVPTSGRIHPDLEDIVGMFVNTVPWRLRVPESDTFRLFVRQAREASLEFLSHEGYPFESIIDDLGIRVSADHNPLFDVMFAYQQSEADVIDVGRVRLHGQEFGHKTAKMDLMLTGSVVEDGLELTFEYATELFDRSTIERLAGHFVTLLLELVSNPDADMSSFSLVTPAERKELLETFNATRRELPPVAGVHELFEQWAEKTPNAEAVVCRDVRWTYAEVQRRAEWVAAWLEAHEARQGDRIALILDPCADQLSAILGVLKSGAAFVPIDASYPTARQSYMIADARVKALITRGRLADDIAFPGPRLDLDRLESGPAPVRAPVRSSLKDAAYVIYTSGSTGKPKGVVVERESVLNLALWSVDDNSVTPGDSLSRYFGFSFDPTISEIFPACITGARLVVVPAELRLEPKGLSAYLEEHGVTIAAFPTQFGEQYLLLTETPTFRRVTLCGEKLRAFREGPWTLVNGYGPTETTCYSSSFVVARSYENIPIGKPLWNTQILVLDKRGRLCPIGIPGELCIAGKGVARGYLNQPELTQEKFVPHPFEAGARMYRTGDLARWLPGGNLEYLGRVDRQVKIRGFRVELGEIEAALLAIDGIENAAVVDAKDASGATVLVAYVVAKGPIDAQHLHGILAKQLPEFIVPAHFQKLDALPLTPNGKVDRKALPAVEIGAGMPVEPPASEMEECLVGLWAKVLGMDKERVSVTTHFVDLGGHSLKAIALVTEIYRELSIELKVGDVFRFPTVRALAERVGIRTSRAPLPPIARAAPAESYPVSSVQERMFLLQELDKGSVTYNVPSVYQVDPSVDKAEVVRALQLIAERHDAFRISFVLVGTSPRARVADHVELPLEAIKATESTREETFSTLMKPFDMGTAPLAHAAWVDTEAGAYLFLDMHHAVIDGTSTQLLLDELTSVVKGVTLPEAGRGLVDCAVWERGTEAQALIATQREHWQATFPDGVPALELLPDFPRPAVATSEGATLTEEISPETLRALRTLGQRNGLSLYNLCLAALNVFLSRMTRQTDIVVGTPVTGRWHPAMQNVCGMFVNTLVLLNRPEPTLPFLDFAREVTRRSLEALDNQAFPFADLVELYGKERRSDRNPLFDVMLVVNELADRVPKTDAALFAPCVVESNHAKFDLTLGVEEDEDRLVLTMEYRTSLFRQGTIESFLRSMRTLVEDIVARPTATIGSLKMLSREDQEMVEVRFNQTERQFPRETTAHSMFERVAANNPEHRALVDAERTYTYAEADACANRLARRLRDLGVGTESVVAIWGDPCSELFLAELGVLKAGGAFLPIDHRTPRERVEFVLRDSGSVVLLASAKCDAELDWVGPRLALDAKLFQNGDATPLRNDGQNEGKRTDLAYIIYTSGSTGRPKGVAIEHGSFTDFIHRSAWQYALSPSDRCSKYAGIGFDASILEAFPALCTGAELHVVPDAIRLSPTDLSRWMEQSQITWAFLPTQLGEAFMEVRPPTSLRFLSVGGDRLRKVAKVPYTVLNEYGPTEFTVCATAHVVESPDDIPIGKPNPNTKVFVLDAAGELCPVGVPGELCLAGAGLGRGYVGSPELTAKRFVSHRLADRMYRTGDLARWRPDGNLDFLGRIDSQVKIRGYRIELGEIEQVILEMPEVTGCVVSALEDEAHDLVLVAYVIMAGEGVTAETVRERVAARLPEYMVPAAVVRIGEIPFTTSGKVDRKRLPRPELRPAERTVVAAQNAEQALVLSAFERTLGISQIGIDDDFFALGGNSIKAIAAVAALANDFKINANDLFRLRTARAIAREIPAQRADLESRLLDVAASVRAPLVPTAEFERSRAAYLERALPYRRLSLERKETYRNILLTGATGFLGCFLMRELLKRTNAKLLVPVRAPTRADAWKRLTKRSAHFFGAGALEYHRRRVIVVPSDLAQPRFGLEEGTFEQLAGTVDCVIHAAALTKHYGDYSAFVAANVDTTRELAELARRAKCAFNLISTMSVGGGEVAGRAHTLFTEFDCDIGQEIENYYVRTKLEAEKVAMRLRDEGAPVNVFRVGFLTGDARTQRFQENLEDSGFVQKLRSYLTLGAMPKGALVHSFCPVNEVAEAIFRLMMTSSLQEEIHHIDRFLTSEEAERIASEREGLALFEDAAFYEWLARNLRDPGVATAAAPMLLHEGLLDEAGETSTTILRDRTDMLLARLGFAWSTVSPEHVWSMLEPPTEPLENRPSFPPEPWLSTGSYAAVRI